MATVRRNASQGQGVPSQTREGQCFCPCAMLAQPGVAGSRPRKIKMQPVDRYTDLAHYLRSTNYTGVPVPCRRGWHFCSREKLCSLRIFGTLNHQANTRDCHGNAKQSAKPALSLSLSPLCVCNSPTADPAPIPIFAPVLSLEWFSRDVM